MTPKVQAMPELPEPLKTMASWPSATMEGYYIGDQMHAYALAYAESLGSELEAARAALEMTYRKNSHDMLLTGDELRVLSASLTLKTKEQSNG